MDNSKNRHNNDHLGVNKMGKNIRKSPLHQPNVAANNNANRQQPQPQVYNISKNDFRNIVQQLTGSPSQETLPRPPQNTPKPQSMRLQKIRPPPLTPINKPQIPPMVHAPAPAPAAAPAPAPAPLPPPVPYNIGLVRPPPQYGQSMPQFGQLQPGNPWESPWANTADSPISAYMRDLQNVIGDYGPRGNQVLPRLQAQHPHVPGQNLSHPPTSGLLPNPPVPGLPSPRINGPAPPIPNLPPPQMTGPPLLPSPTSQFLLPSPTVYMNLLSPRSPYPLLSPGVQFPPPLTPNFPFSPMAQSGILGPGPQPLPSPGLFPLSPSGFFPIFSPRWREQ